MEDSLELKKAKSPISVNVSGKVMDFRPEQPAKALAPIFVTLLPKVTEVIWCLFMKASDSMLVILSGIVIDLGSFNPKTPGLKHVIPGGITMEGRAEQPKKALKAMAFKL